MLRGIPKSGIFRVGAASILSAMIVAIAVYMSLIGYVKDNKPNYHHLPWQMRTFFVKSLISLKITEFTIGFPQTQALTAAVLRISFGKSWQLSIYYSGSLVSVSWYSWSTSNKILLYDTAVDTLSLAGLLLSSISAIQTGVSGSNRSKDGMKLQREHILLWHIRHFNFPASALIKPGTPSTATNNLFTWNDNLWKNDSYGKDKSVSVYRYHVTSN